MTEKIVEREEAKGEVETHKVRNSSRVENSGVSRETTVWSIGEDVSFPSIYGQPLLNGSSSPPAISIEKEV